MIIKVLCLIITVVVGMALIMLIHQLFMIMAIQAVGFITRFMFYLSI